MKIKTLSVIFSSVIFLASCSGDNGKQGPDSLKGDTTMHDITRPTGENLLEDLLKIKNEGELKSKFGEEHVSYDTVWGPEGMYTMGSYIDKGTKDEVQIVWQDSLHRSKMNAAMAKAWYDTASGNYVFNCSWRSERGVRIGTTTDELENLNGKAFVFSGFGWDYGGGIRDWQGGMLDRKGLRIDLTESESIGKIPETEYTQILGDQDIKSDHPVVKKIQPKVYRIAVYEPE